MGTLDPGLICPTDGLDYMQTPGYFGHINLACPLFYIQYLSTIIKVLRCVCFKCSKLLISKEKYKQALDMPPDARWNFIFSLASKVERCGEETHNGCGCKQPKKIKKEGNGREKRGKNQVKWRKLRKHGKKYEKTCPSNFHVFPQKEIIMLK